MAEVSFAKAKASAVDAEVIKETVATPVPGVTVETVTTIAAPAPVVAPAAAIPTAPAPLAVAAPAPLPVAQHDPTAFDDDNLGFEDVILPRINIVQKVGELSNMFDGGEIVLNQEVVIHTPQFIHADNPALNTPGTGPLNITVIGFRKRQFAEKVSGGKRGILLNNEADVPKNNGTLDYGEWQASLEAAKVPGGPVAKRYFERLATAMVLIERPAFIPDEGHLLFPYDCEGKYYALALWSMKGVAYTNAAKKVFFTQRKIGSCRGGYLTHGWTLTSKLNKYGENFAYAPVVKSGPLSSEAFKAFAREIVG